MKMSNIKIRSGHLVCVVVIAFIKYLSSYMKTGFLLLGLNTVLQN